MEYTVSKLARLSGVSARTLRYYDEIDLLKPKRVSSSGYRIYGQEEINLLQQILFYRELELNLDEIKGIIHSEKFDVKKALKNHLIHLNQQKDRLERLIGTVEKSIQAQEGGRQMSDKEKFEAFKKEAIDKNEEKYGEEIREKYGSEVVEKSNKNFLNMSEEKYAEYQELSKELNTKLAEATEIGDPNTELAQEVAALHKDWLMFAWPEGLYDKEKHYNLSLMYVEDPRFKAYYEEIAPGAAEFLHEALKVYLGINNK